MSKDYFILNNGRVLYAPGHYDRKDAEAIALAEAGRHPGRTYRVVQQLSVYQRRIGDRHG